MTAVASACLIIDTSVSMTSHGYVANTVIDSKAFVTYALVGDAIAVVNFDVNGNNCYAPNGKMAVVSGTLNEVAAATTAISGLSFQGTCTNMGGGIQAAYNLLNASTITPKAAVLLSDGEQNCGTSPLSVVSSTTAPVYSCAMGPASDQNLLRQIASTTNAVYYYMPYPINMMQIYNQIRAIQPRTQVVQNSMAAMTTSNQSLLLPANISSTSELQQVGVVWSDPTYVYSNNSSPTGNQLYIALYQPSGQISSATPTRQGPGYVIIRHPQSGGRHLERLCAVCRQHQRALRHHRRIRVHAGQCLGDPPGGGHALASRGGRRAQRDGADAARGRRAGDDPDDHRRSGCTRAQHQERAHQVPRRDRRRSRDAVRTVTRRGYPASPTGPAAPAASPGPRHPAASDYGRPDGGGRRRIASAGLFRYPPGRLVQCHGARHRLLRRNRKRRSSVPDLVIRSRSNDRPRASRRRHIGAIHASNSRRCTYDRSRPRSCSSPASSLPSRSAAKAFIGDLIANDALAVVSFNAQGSVAYPATNTMDGRRSDPVAIDRGRPPRCRRLHLYRSHPSISASACRPPTACSSPAPAAAVPRVLLIKQWYSRPPAAPIRSRLPTKYKPTWVCASAPTTNHDACSVRYAAVSHGTVPLHAGGYRTCRPFSIRFCVQLPGSQTVTNQNKSVTHARVLAAARDARVRACRSAVQRRVRECKLHPNEFFQSRPQPGQRHPGRSNRHHAPDGSRVERRRILRVQHTQPPGRGSGTCK